VQEGQRLHSLLRGASRLYRLPRRGVCRSGRDGLRGAGRLHDLSDQSVRLNGPRGHGRDWDNPLAPDALEDERRHRMPGGLAVSIG
jgi:hypothetical protein